MIKFYSEHWYQSDCVNVSLEFPFIERSKVESLSEFEKRAQLNLKIILEFAEQKFDVLYKDAAPEVLKKLKTLTFTSHACMLGTVTIKNMPEWYIDSYVSLLRDECKINLSSELLYGSLMTSHDWRADSCDNQQLDLGSIHVSRDYSKPKKAKIIVEKPLIIVSSF